MPRSDPAPVLHVACLPFPTAQGTQAALRYMLNATAAAGGGAHLLTYGHGAYPSEERFTLHRLANIAGSGSLRSGPSWNKVFLDVAMVAKIRDLRRRLRPRAFVAHHIEAALALRVAGATPVIYVAHTSLETELRYYFSRGHGFFRHVGRLTDATACQGAETCVAVSPSLARILSRATGAEVGYLPIPWSIAPAINDLERRDARARFGLTEEVPVLLYAGNLDAYQGLDDLLVAMVDVVRRTPSGKLLIGTASDIGTLRTRTRALGIEHSVIIAPLATEEGRRLLYAAANVAVVPRKAQGGLPVKLLDTLSRGVPAVATRRATAGLPIDGACRIVADDSPQAIANGALQVLSDPDERAQLTTKGRAYIDKEHSIARFLTTYDGLIARVTNRHASRPERGDEAHQAQQTRRPCTSGAQSAPRNAPPHQIRTPPDTR